jgi:hypothetical protein
VGVNLTAQPTNHDQGFFLDIIQISRRRLIENFQDIVHGSIYLISTFWESLILRVFKDNRGQGKAWSKKIPDLGFAGGGDAALIL